MTSKHTHCYSNYVNHILNTSPTKITYTFSKKQRFSSPNKEKAAPIDQLIHKTIHPQPYNKYLFELPQQITFSPNKLINNYTPNQKQTSLTHNKKNSSNFKKTINSKSKSKTPNKNNQLLNHYLNNQRRKSNQKNQLSRSRSKSKQPKRLTNQIHTRTQGNLHQTTDSKKFSPNKKKVWQKGEQQNKKQRFDHSFLYSESRRNYPFQYANLQQQKNDHLNHRYLKYSPYYRQYMANNGDEGLSPKQRSKLKRSLSQKSKSKSKRIKTATIALQQMDHPSKNITIHGYYPVGIEINPNGKYPVSTYKNVPSHSFGNPDTKHNDRGESPVKIDKSKRQRETKTQKCINGKNVSKSYENYVPFSEFGQVSPFKY